MPKASVAAERIRTKHPKIWQAFSNLAEACHDAGPLDEKTRRLVSLLVSALKA